MRRIECEYMTATLRYGKKGHEMQNRRAVAADAEADAKGVFFRGGICI